jgi:hypothetical protein
MVEFAVASIVAMIILFIGIQFAALARYAIELNHLCYQIARWATDASNNTKLDSSGNAVASPQCTDMVTLLSGGNVAPYDNLYAPSTGWSSSMQAAPGWVGKIAAHAACQSTPPSNGGVAITMTCTAPGGGGTVSCTGQRPAGTQVQVSMIVDTKLLLFLSNPTFGNYSFLGIPFPQSLNSSVSAFTQ